MQTQRRFRQASAALRLPWSDRFCVSLQRLQRSKWMILRIGGRHRRLEKRIRPGGVRIDPQAKRIGREPPKIDDAVDDRLRRIRNLGTAFDALIDEIGECWNLLGRCKNQIDQFIYLVLDRVDSNDAGLTDPRSNMAADLDASSTLGHHIERS